MSSLESKYNTPPVAPYNTSPLLIAFTLGILVLCLVLFIVVYLCKFCFPSLFQQPPASGPLIPEVPLPSGLDSSLMHIFPTFTFASVKDLHPKDKYNVECAICLLEFEDDSMVRLLTLCCHVFHQECIDLWLLTHKTCPVCRTDLESPPTVQISKSEEEGVVSIETNNNEIRIDVREEEGDGVVANNANFKEQRHEHDYHHAVSMSSTNLQQQERSQMFTRSHSTGHSIVLIRGEEGDNGAKDNAENKYTLKLQGHVIKGRHNYTRSCASYNDMKNIVGPCSNCGFVHPISSCSPLAML